MEAIEELQKWALVAEIIGGIAIVLSLIFVGFEIRQSSDETALNTIAIKTNAFYVLSNSISNLNQFRVDNPEFEQIRMKALANDPSLTELEKSRYRGYIQMVFRLSELAHLQYENGIIDEASLRSIVAPMRFHFRQSDEAVAAWQGARVTRRPTFVQYFEDFMKSVVGNCEETIETICEYWQSEKESH